VAASFLSTLGSSSPNPLLASPINLSNLRSKDNLDHVVPTINGYGVVIKLLSEPHNHLPKSPQPPTHPLMWPSSSNPSSRLDSRRGSNPPWTRIQTHWANSSKNLRVAYKGHQKSHLGTWESSSTPSFQQSVLAN
jgi:hypothetical protein